jgi:hypothetical protein
MLKRLRPVVLLSIATLLSGIADADVAAPADPSARPVDVPQPKSRRSKWLAAGGVGLIHATYATWMYFAWYRDANTEDFHLEHGPAFGVSSYAGGADKLGHFWANYALTRATTSVLVAGGWRRLPSSLVASGLSEVAFFLTEVQDGFIVGFDPKDEVANVAGAALGVVMENIPAIDRLFDFRLEYFPSSDYRRAFRETRSIDVAQDYSGQSYMLALHVGALPGTDSEWLRYTRYVDLVLGFETQYFVPTPQDATHLERQTLYGGLAVNMQAVLQGIFAPSTPRHIGEGFFEVASLPLTTFRYVELSRSPMPPAMQ